MEFRSQLQKWHDDDEYEKIIEAIRNIPQGERDLDLVKQLARALNNMKRYDEALAVLESERQQGEEDSGWNFYMGWAYYHRPYIKNGAMKIDKSTFEAALSYLIRAKELGNSNTDKLIKQITAGLEWLEKESQTSGTTRKKPSKSKKTAHIMTEWKQLLDDCCADELEELMINDIKAGFLSDEEIQEECELYIEDDYPEDEGKIDAEGFSAIIAAYRKKYQNSGAQENFLKLDSAFHNMEKRGIVTEHCVGYTLSDGFSDCNESASELREKGDKIVGCCFYTMQDLEHLFHDHTTVLYFAFGNYNDKPSADEIGRMIVEELEKAGFSTDWNQSPDTRIAITNMRWDKQYCDEQ